MKIKKVSQPLKVGSVVINDLSSNSTTDAPSIAAVNAALANKVRQGGVQGDFNDLKDFGNCIFYVEATANAPTSSNYYIMEQQVAGDFIKQTAKSLFDSSIYARSYDANQNKWSPWQNINNIYSTEEIVIGTWIDGKPLYRKVIDTGAFRDGDTSIRHNIANLKRGIIYGYAHRDVYDDEINIPFSNADNAISVKLGKENLEINSTWNPMITESYITIEYTKTTD